VQEQQQRLNELEMLITKKLDKAEVDKFKRIVDDITKKEEIRDVVAILQEQVEKFDNTLCHVR
jgi:hypothetical protein